MSFQYVLARPMYGPPVPFHCKTLLRESIVAERRGYHMVAELSPVGAHLIAARNQVVKAFLRSDLHKKTAGILWMDTDISFLAHGQLADFLAGARERHLAAGCYYVKSGDHRPTWGGFGERDAEGKMTRLHDSDDFRIISWQDGPGITGWERIPNGACGFGLAWTSTELLKYLGPGDATQTSGNGPFTKLPDIAEPGDDYSFCARVGALGLPEFDLWIHHDSQLGHWGAEGCITQEHFVAAQIAKQGKAQAEGKVEEI
jgi:hypothetical protein